MTPTDTDRLRRARRILARALVAQGQKVYLVALFEHLDEAVAAAEARDTVMERAVAAAGLAKAC